MRLFILISLIQYSLFGNLVFSKSKIDGGKKSQQVLKRNKLRSLIKMEMKALTNLKYAPTRLKYRLFELHAEELKLINEEDNEKFIKNATSGKKKASFFIKTRAKEKIIERLGHNLINKKNSTRYKSFIYFTLSQIFRDSSKVKKEGIFLYQALRYSQTNTEIHNKINVALAEHHYNKKEFKKSLNFYNKILHNKRDPWIAKHYYSAGWCELKLKRPLKAFSLIVRALNFSSQKDYINFKNQIFDSLALFSVASDQVPQGLQLLKERAQSPSKYYISMAFHAQERGKINSAIKILNYAENDILSKKQNKEYTSILIAGIDIYRNIQKMDGYFKYVKKLDEQFKNNFIDTKEKEDLIEKYKSLANFYQVTLSKEYTQKSLTRVSRLFKSLVLFDPEKSNEYYYFEARTFHDLSLYPQAFKLYLKALNNSTPKEAPLLEKIFDSCFNILATNKLPSILQLKHTLTTYKKHLFFWPKKQSSVEIYQKLFNLYLKEKRPSLAIDILKKYNKNFPQNIKVQQSMFAIFLDGLIAKKDTLKLAFWVQEIDKGFLKLNKKFLKDTVGILGDILFKKSIELEKQGQQKLAIKNLEDIFNNRQYPDKIKGDSALYLAQLNQYTAAIKKSYHWANTALRYYTTKQAFNKRADFIRIIDIYPISNNFYAATKLSDRFMKDYCQKSFKEKKHIFNNLIQFNLLQKKNKNALNALSRYEKCGFNDQFLGQIKIQMINHYSNFNDYYHFFKLAKHLENKINQETKLALLKSAEKLYWRSVKENKTLMAKKTKGLIFKYSDKKSKLAFAIKSLEGLENDARSFFKLANSFEQEQSFNPEIFNKKLEKTLNNLKSFNSKIEKNLRQPASYLQLRTLYFQKESFKAVYKKLENFTPISGDKEFILTFKKEMRPLIQGLKQKYSSFNQLGKKLIENNLILTSFNKDFYPELVEYDSRHSKTQLINLDSLGDK
jgi:hypothetical protein